MCSKSPLRTHEQKKKKNKKERDPSETESGLEVFKKSISIKTPFIRSHIPNPMGLVVISPAFDKGGNRKIDIERFGKFLVEELPRIGPKVYLIYKDLLSPDDEHPATDSGHQHNVVVSPFMQQRGW